MTRDRFAERARKRASVSWVRDDQRTVHGLAIGLLPREAFARVADDRGIVRTVHLRYIFDDWTPDA